LRSAYAEQVEGLLEGGADLLLIETIFDTLNAKAAIAAIGDVTEARGLQVPVMNLRHHHRPLGRLLSGQTPAAFWNSVGHAAPFSIGLNCALGARRCAPNIAEIARIADTLVVAPIPMRLSQRVRADYDESPEFMAGAARGICGCGLSSTSVGGCCGTTPSTSSPSCAAVEGQGRRGRSQSCRRCCACPASSASRSRRKFRSSTVGERTNVTGSAKFRKLITAATMQAALAIARDQVENGAQIIDVNMDEGLLDSEKAMTPSSI
jgi:5-methyltetrahydrofolate--homocysteine methyltransferase